VNERSSDVLRRD